MSIEHFFKFLPYRFALAAAHLPDGLLEQAYEIRLRRGGAASVSAKNKNVPFNESGVSSVDNAMKTQKSKAPCGTLLFYTNSSKLRIVRWHSCCISSQ